jgi:hypothetical protein
MRKMPLLLTLLNALRLLGAQVCLPAEMSCSQTPLNPFHDRKSIGADLIVRQQFYRSLTSHGTVRCCTPLQSP